jgi:hypothetical protein
MAEWHTIESLRERWPDAPYEDEYAEELLLVARVQVMAYGPELEDPEVPTDSYRMAQFLQARNIWSGAVKNDDGGIGPDGFSVAPKPLDWHVKQLLRPTQGVPLIG